jgi:hypothetical protein
VRRPRPALGKTKVLIEKKSRRTEKKSGRTGAA